MKYIYIILGIACVVGIGSFFLNKKDLPQSVSSIISDNSITLYRESGDISWKESQGDEYKKVTDDKTMIPNNVYVKTDTGRGYVILPDNSSITLSSSTEINIAYTENKTSILQMLGSTYHRVQTLTQGKQYEIRTPNTLAAVRGTKFSVTYNPKMKKTFVSVTEHTVSVSPVTTGTTTKEAPTLIKEGNTASVVEPESTSNVSPSTKTLVAVSKTENVQEVKDWISENKPIDAIYDKEDDKTIFIENVIQKIHEEGKGDQKDSKGDNHEDRTKLITNVLKKIVEEKDSKDIDGTKNDKTIDIKDKTKEKEDATTKVDTKIDTKTTPAITPTTKTSDTSVNTPQATVALKKFDLSNENMSSDDEGFVDTFYNLYEKLLYVEDPVTYCKRVGAMSPVEIMNQLLAVTNKAGYILPKQTDVFALSVDMLFACKNNTMTDQLKSFRSRFDEVYPYSQ